MESGFALHSVKGPPETSWSQGPSLGAQLQILRIPRTHQPVQGAASGRRGGLSGSYSAFRGGTSCHEGIWQQKWLECRPRESMGSRGPVFVERGSERTFFVAAPCFFHYATAPFARKLWVFVATAHLRLFRFPFFQGSAPSVLWL